MSGRGERHLDDEELGEPLSRSTLRHLEGCKSCSRRHASVVALQVAIRALPRTAEPPPSALELLRGPPRSSRALRPTRRRGLVLGALVGLAGLAGLSVLAGWRAPMREALAQEIALDHLHYERNAAAAEVVGELSGIEAFFAETLRRSPRLAALEGAAVVGGKRCRIGGEWSALVWIERGGHWLSFFSMPQDAVTRRGCSHAAGVNVCGIPDPRGGSRVLAGKLPEAELLRLLDESTQ